MWNRMKFTAVGFTLLLASGCSSSLVGAWSPTAPTVHEGEFSSMQFRADGSFSAVSVRAGEDLLTNGKYEFDGIALTLKPPGKAMKSYRATYIMSGKTLTLKGEGIDQKLKKK